MFAAANWTQAGLYVYTNAEIQHRPLVTDHLSMLLIYTVYGK